MSQDVASHSRIALHGAYPPPQCPRAQVDGGINRWAIAPAPGAGVVITTGLLGNLLPGDVFRIHWKTLGNIVYEQPVDHTGDPQIAALVSGTRILSSTPDETEATIQVWYSIVRPLEELYSDPLDLVIDFKAPGGTPQIPDPPNDSENLNKNLKPIPELDQSIPKDTDVDLHVPAWTYMDAGDSLIVEWGGQQLGPYVITPPQVGLPVLVHVDKSIIAARDPKVQYYIVDKVKNHSRRSIPQIARIEMPLLTAPHLPNHPGDIDLDQLDNVGVVVQAIDAAIKTGDRVTLVTERYDASGAPLPSTEQSATAQSIIVDFRVDKNTIVPSLEGEVRFRYRISRTPTDLLSATTQRRVVGALSFPAPALPESNGGQLDGSLAQATLRIPSTASLKNGDIVEGFFAGQSLGTKNATPGQTLDFPILGALIASNQGKDVDAYYTVKRGTNSYRSTLLPIKVTLPATPTLPPPSVPESRGGQLDGGLTRATVVVPASALQANDVVTAYFGNSPLGTQTATPGKDMEFNVTESDIRAKQGTSLNVYYKIVRNAAVVPSRELPLFVTRPAGPSLPAPSVLEAAGGQLDGGLPQATLRVPSTATLDASDMVEAFFAGSSLGRRQATPSIAMDFTISGTLISANRNQQVNIQYVVTRGTSTYPSQNAQVFVTQPAVPAFPAPTIPQSNGGQLDGTLPQATLAVPSAAPLQAGDTVEGVFHGQSLGSRSATPGQIMNFTIPGTLIAPNQGSTVKSNYVVTRNGSRIPSSDLTVTITRPSNPWDETFDFDSSPIQDVSSKNPSQQLRFENVFYWFFDRNHLPIREQFIGVKAVSGSVPDMSSGRVLRIGHDTVDTLTDKRVLCQFWKTWSRVRFAVTAIDDPVSIYFYEDLPGNFSDSWPSLGHRNLSASPRQQEVIFDAPTGKKIKWISIACPDTIHLDFFKMKI